MKFVREDMSLPAIVWQATPRIPLCDFSSGEPVEVDDKKLAKQLKAMGYAEFSEPAPPADPPKDPPTPPEGGEGAEGDKQ